MNKYFIVSGDKRSSYLAEILKMKGYEVYTLNVPEVFDNVSEDMVSDEKFYDDLILVLPVPVGGFLNSEDEKRVVENIKLFSGVCGGVIPEEISAACIENDIFCYDYMKDNDVAVKNAVATAEGAITEAFMMSSINIEESFSLVTGYGRCAIALAKKLKALGSNVTITARSVEACLKAEMDGFEAILMKKLCEYPRLGEFDYCFNTVPAMVLTADILSKFSSDITIIDVASKPGGTDFRYCDLNHLKYKHSLGIPGRYSPKTSAHILAEVIEKKFARP